MKAILSNRVYIQVTPEQRAFIEGELTYKLYKSKGAGKPKPYFLKMYVVVREDLLSIPAGREDLIPEGHEIVDKRSAPPADFPPFGFVLRDSQQEILDQVDSNCIINAQPSWGKTFSGIAIAAKLQVKTLVIVHTLFLRDQWISEIRKTLGIEAGIISGATENIDSPIVVANIQSLRTKAAKYKQTFGLVIVDEAHHTPASTFRTVVDALHCKYRIGLSGTINRKDGLGVVLTDYFSPKMFKPPEENMMRPTVLCVTTDISFSDDPNKPWALKVNDLYNDPDYQQIVLNAAHEYAEMGHVVLVVSDRVEILEFYHEILEEDSVLITGSVKNREALLDLVRSGEKKIIFGTVSIFAEGISIEPLSCLIPALPMNNASLIQQLIGRIVRICENKLDPVALDFILQGNVARRQSNARKKVYIDHGYKLKSVSLFKK